MGSARNQVSSSRMGRQTFESFCVFPQRESRSTKAMRHRFAFEWRKASFSFVGVSAVFLLCLDWHRSPLLPAECTMSFRRVPVGNLLMEPIKSDSLDALKHSEMGIKRGGTEGVRRRQKMGVVEKFSRSLNDAAYYSSFLELSAKQTTKKNGDEDGSEDSEDDEAERASSAKEGEGSEKADEDSAEGGNGSSKEESKADGGSDDGGGHHLSGGHEANTSDKHDTEEHASEKHEPAGKPREEEDSDGSEKRSKTHHGGKRHSLDAPENMDPDSEEPSSKYKVQFNFEPGLLIPSDMRAKVKQRKVAQDGVEWFQVGSAEPPKLLSVEGAKGEDKFLHQIHVENRS
ncbi:hypothetical protein TGP89_273860 [Toxoplasma gondii p89]|uniref:Uncharacterized protein n=1 Tax=Toxoplasma gondii p89 TaxID=943119 RepID=A0A086L4J8_TOXGO|nr:hypothetical protein TGP89_273860 [Toxoplasma gondii p89]